MPTIKSEMPAGAGRLILVVGPSGAGKDTLISRVRADCAGDRGIAFPRRVVTREASSHEDNEQVSAETFRQLLRRGDFAIHWEAHGHCYALPRSVDEDLRAGRVVVANVSRAVVEVLRRSYPDVTVVLVTAPSEILAERLTARSRGSDGQLAHRLGRAVADVGPEVTLINVGSVAEHAGTLLRIIRGDEPGQQWSGTGLEARP